MYRPYLTVARDWTKPKPPENEEQFRVRDLVKLDVKYPNPGSAIIIPDEYLLPAIREYRKNLEYAVSLEKEIGGYELELSIPIEPDPDHKGDSLERTLGISAALLFFVGLFKRLTDKDCENARMEALAWPIDDETVFARLRIWVCGDTRIFSGSEAGQILCGVKDRMFWHGRHQRDLLLVLAKRWADLPPKYKTELEARLVQGPPRWEEEGEAEYSERNAGYSLTRIHWLRSQGCEFGFDFDELSSRLRERAPAWRLQYAENAVASMEGRGGWVQTNTEYAALLDVPLGRLLDRAKELSGRTHDMLVETDPYAGLSAMRPVRAFAALTKSAKLSSYPEWAWRTFLHSEARKTDKPRLFKLIAEHISRFPTDALLQLIHPVCDWFLTSSGILLRQFPRQFERVWGAVVTAVKSQQGNTKFLRLQGDGQPDWATDALNSPVGKLAQALMQDPQLVELPAGNGLPRPWITRAEELLSLQGDHRRYTLVILSHRLKWLFAIDPAWTKSILLSVLDTENDDQKAIWAGFFWSGEIPNRDLFLLLKPRLIELAQNKSLTRRTHGEVLAGILLAGWASEGSETGERYVSHTEIRTVLVNADEEFRLQTLWQVGRWATGKDEKVDKWVKDLPIFLTQAWPLQITAKSPRITAVLCDLAITDLEKFPERVDLILPLVTTLDHDYTGLHLAVDAIDEIGAKKMLVLLNKVLPHDAAMWPYGSSDLLDRISNLGPALLKNPQLLELKRRWAAR